MCTGIRITATNGDIVYARTLEFDTPLPTVVGFVPRGQSLVGSTPTGRDGLEWTTKYAYTGCIVRTTMGGVEIDSAPDAMNEHGLVAGSFNLPGYSEFPAVTDENRKKVIASWEIMQFIVGNYKTTAEAAEGIARGDFIVGAVDFPFPGKPGQFPIQVRVGDATGHTIVAHWSTPDAPPSIDEAGTGIVTNSPPYPFHVKNMLQFDHLSAYNPSGPFTEGSQDYKQTMGDGYLGMPGGSSSPDRFIRASLYARDTYPGDDGESAAWAAWHVINNFDLPPGILRNVDADTKAEISEYTLWSSVADTKNLVYYLRSATDNGIYKVDLKQMDFDGKERLENPAPSSVTRRTIDAFPAA